MVMGESAGGDVYGIGQHMLTNGKVCYSKIQLSSEEVVSTWNIVKKIKKQEIIMVRKLVWMN